MKYLINLLKDPLVRNIDVDGVDRLAIHRRMLDRKRLLRDVFMEFHTSFNSLDKKFFTARGSRVEIGAGVSPIKNSFPDVIATDIVLGPGLDRTLNALDMDLESDSVRVIFGQNCFHHFPDPHRFFKELERVLPNGGGAILLEPYYGPFATFLFQRLFTTEGYDKDFPSWKTPAVGPMNGANQALSYIVFVRDRKKFEEAYPSLKVVYKAPCSNYIKYLVSGGLNFIQLLPDWTSPLINFFQWILFPLNRWLALHHIIVIRKVSK